MSPPSSAPAKPSADSGSAAKATGEQLPRPAQEAIAEAIPNLEALDQAIAKQSSLRAQPLLRQHALKLSDRACQRGKIDTVH